MNEVLRTILPCALMTIWIIVWAAASIFVFYKHSSRIYVAGASGLATLITLTLATIVGLLPHRVEAWLVIAVATTLAFLGALLWTYLTPLLRGTTFDDMLKDATRKIEEAKRNRGDKHT